MNLIKTSEKIIIWMHRNEVSQIELASKLNTNRQSVANKIKDNSFTVGDLLVLKSLGCEL